MRDLGVVGGFFRSGIGVRGRGGFFGVVFFFVACLIVFLLSLFLLVEWYVCMVLRWVLCRFERM